MICHKIMGMLKTILVVSVLCLKASSVAGDSCIFCDPATGKNYMDCTFENLAILPVFLPLKPTLQRIALDTEKFVKDMKVDGPVKDKSMKDAMAYSICSVSSEEKNNAIIMKLLQYCFRAVNKDPDQVFLNDCKAIAEQQKYSSTSKQRKDETQADNVYKWSQHANYPPQYNFPQGSLMTTASLKEQINPSMEKNGRNPFNPDKQNRYQHDDILQQTFSASDANAYSSHQNVDWNPPLYYNGQAQKQNSYQQPTTNQSNTRVISSSATSSSSFSASSFYGSPLLNQQAPAQRKTPVNSYNQQQNYQGNPNAFPITSRRDFFNNKNKPGSTLMPDTWNNQLYGDNSNYNLPNRIPNTFNLTNYLSRYSGNQNVWKNSQTSALAYSNAGQQSNILNIVPYFKPSPVATPPNNYPIKYPFSSPLINIESDADAVSSFYLKKYSPVNNQQYPLPYTVQSNPNPNDLITAKKIEPDTNLQNVPNAKDDQPSKSTVFSQTMYGILCDAPSVMNVINEKTTKSQLKLILKYLVFYALNMCGYPQVVGQKCADDSGNFVDGLPQGLPTSIQIKAICEMMKMQFISTNMIGDNPVAQGQCLGKYMKDGFEKIQQSPVSSGSQPILNSYPTKEANYDQRYPNTYPANQQVTGIPNKQINNNNEEYIDDSPLSYNKSKQMKTNKKNDQSNFYTDSKTSNNDGYKDYFTTQIPQTGKMLYPYNRKNIPFLVTKDANSTFSNTDDYYADWDWGSDDEFDDNSGTAEQTTGDSDSNSDDYFEYNAGTDEQTTGDSDLNSDDYFEYNAGTVEQTIKNPPRVIQDLLATGDSDSNSDDYFEYKAGTDEQTTGDSDLNSDDYFEYNAGPVEQTIKNSPRVIPDLLATGDSDSNSDDYFEYNAGTDEQATGDSDLNYDDYFEYNAGPVEQTIKNPPRVIQDLLAKQPVVQQPAPAYPSLNQRIKNNLLGINQRVNQNPYTINKPQANLTYLNSFPKQKNVFQVSNLPPKQPNQPYLYGINYQSAVDKSKQQSNEPQFLNYQEDNVKDNRFAINQGNPTFLGSSEMPPIKQYPLDIPQNSDAFKNTPAIDSSADSRNRVKILIKMTIACFDNSNFNFKSYSKGIEMVANMTKVQHPEMPIEEAKALTLVDALFAVIQILKSIQKVNPDAIQQLQMTDVPLQLPQNTPPNYQNPQQAMLQRMSIVFQQSTTPLTGSNFQNVSDDQQLPILEQQPATASNGNNCQNITGDQQQLKFVRLPSIPSNGNNILNITGDKQQRKFVQLPSIPSNSSNFPNFTADQQQLKYVRLPSVPSNNNNFPNITGDQQQLKYVRLPSVPSNNNNFPNITGDRQQLKFVRLPSIPSNDINIPNITGDQQQRKFVQLPSIPSNSSNIPNITGDQQ